MVENAGEVNRVLAAQENEMRSQMVAAATAMAGVDINGGFGATMAARSAFVGDPADKIKVAAWEAAQKLADGLGGDRRKDPSGAMADAGMVALNALKHNKGPDGNPLNEYQENMVSSAVGSANMAAGGGMVPAAAARSSRVNGIDGDVAIEQPLPHYQPLPRHEPPVAGIGDHHYDGPPRGKLPQLSAAELADLNQAMQRMVADQQIAEITRLFGQNLGDMTAARQPTTLPEFAPKTKGHEMS